MQNVLSDLLFQFTDERSARLNGFKCMCAQPHLYSLFSLIVHLPNSPFSIIVYPDRPDPFFLHTCTCMQIYVWCKFDVIDKNVASDNQLHVQHSTVLRDFFHSSSDIEQPMDL